MKILSCVGLLLAAAGLSSCLSGDLNTGQTVINPNQLQIQPIDSVTVQTSTVIVPDSFVTSADTNVVVGQWTDDQTGTLLARGVVTLDYVANDFDDQTDLRLDSLVLELPYAFAYGDTTVPFTMAVHPLTRPLAAAVYYTGSQAAYEPTPLAQRTGLIRLNRGNGKARFRLPGTLAQSVWAKLTSGEIQDATTLANILPGFALVGQATGSNLIVGFPVSSAAGVRLYYHSTSSDQSAASVLFPLTGTHFSQLLTNRSGTPLQALQERTSAVSSSQTDQRTFVGAGLRTRIEFPYIDSFERPDLFVGLNAAILTIEPIRRSLTDNAPPPAELALYQTNSQNELVSSLTSGYTGSAAVATYAYDPTALELTDAYGFDLTAWFSQLVKGTTTNRPLLLVIPPGQTDLQTLIRHVSLGNGQRSTDRIRLRLFLTSSV